MIISCQMDVRGLPQLNYGRKLPFNEMNLKILSEKYVPAKTGRNLNNIIVDTS